MTDSPDPRLLWAAAAVAKACEGRHVRQASSYQSITDVFLEPRKIRYAVTNDRGEWIAEHGPMPPKFGAEMLRRAARAGLIDGRDIMAPHTTRSEWRFTTCELAAKWDAERALSDGERAERTAAAVRKMYAANRAEYGDKVWRWAVSSNLAAVPQDGIRHAIDGGLLVSVSLPRLGGGYLVPAEEHDAFTDAHEACEAHQARLKDRHDDLVNRLHAICGGYRTNVAHLTSQQIEAILEAVNPGASV